MYFQVKEDIKLGKNAGFDFIKRDLINLWEVGTSYQN